MPKILRIDPVLATEIGLEESIVLNQVDFLLKLADKSKNGKKNGFDDKEGNHWTYQTYEDWIEKDFPFWSARILRGHVHSLAKKELIHLKRGKYRVLIRLSEKGKAYFENDQNVIIKDQIGRSQNQIGRSPASSEITSENTKHILKKTPTTPLSMGEKVYQLPADNLPHIDAYLSVKKQLEGEGLIFEEEVFQKQVRNCLDYYGDKFNLGKLKVWLRNYKPKVKGKIFGARDI